MSEVEVNSYELYDKQQRIVRSGPLDMKMGVGKKDLLCATCKRTIETCPGHFGHLRLNLPIVHIGFFKALLNILKCVCKTCGNVLLAEEQKNDMLKKMLKLSDNPTARAVHSKKLVKECGKNKKCSECQAVNPSAQKVPRMAGKIEYKYTNMGKEIAEKLRREYEE